MEFTLKEGTEHIELIKLLKICNVVNSGGEGKHLIKNSLVTVNGKNETRKKNKIRRGDIVEVNNEKIKVV